jgi:hypothetical protein
MRILAASVTQQMLLYGQTLFSKSASLIKMILNNNKISELVFSGNHYLCAVLKKHESRLKSIFVGKLIAVLNFCILINNGLTPVQKFKTL